MTEIEFLTNLAKKIKVEFKLIFKRIQKSDISQTLVYVRRFTSTTQSSAPGNCDSGGRTWGIPQGGRWV